VPTLRQFEAYLTVVDEGSFTRAAQQLAVSQPGLSQQVAALERELGLPVYDSIAATLWGSLRLVSREHADMTEPSLAGWGSMFAIPSAAGRRAT